MSKHVAVLMGGWSAERDVSLRSGAACAAALARLGYRVSPIDVARDIAAVLGRFEAGRGAQRAARPPGRGRHAAGRAGDSRRSLHPFGRARLRARHAEGHGQAGPCAPPAIPVPEGLVASRFEAAQQASPAAALCGQADRGGLQRRRFHRDARTTATRRRSSTARIGPMGIGSSSKNTLPARS